jgi:hypothetical protein
MNTFEELINVLSGYLNQHLNPEFRKIWVQSHLNSNNVRFVFTIFNSDNTYQMRFLDLKNVRLPKNTSTEEEINQITSHFLSSINPIVSEFITD